VQNVVKAWLPEGDDALKFGECFVRATYYMLGFFCCTYIVSQVDYWPDTTKCWEDVYTTYVNWYQASLTLMGPSYPIADNADH
jgi:hypothetical protein